MLPVQLSLGPPGCWVTPPPASCSPQGDPQSFLEPHSGLQETLSPISLWGLSLDSGKTPFSANPDPKIAIPERLVEGLGLRPWLGLKLGPRLGSAAGLAVGEEQQTTGQG